MHVQLHVPIRVHLRSSAVTNLFSVVVLLSVFSGFTSCHAQEGSNDRFGIYTATLDGQNMQLIIAHPSKEMTHPRISSNKQWITFTRYTKIGPEGVAQEKEGYLETEIMLVGSDGTKLETLIPAKKGILNANSSWTPDGKSIIFISTDNPDNIPQLYRLNLKTRKSQRIPTPRRRLVSDPNQVDDWLIFPIHPVGNDGQQSLWMMKTDGSHPRQITFPAIPTRNRKLQFLPGDYDPHLSPDASKAAFMRYFGESEWHIMVVDLQTGKENDLTRPVLAQSKTTAEGVVTWSSDGRLLLFRHIELPNIKKVGLYTMRPNGTQRRMIPLPRGYFYGAIVCGFPGEGSSSTTRILFHAKKDARF